MENETTSGGDRNQQLDFEFHQHLAGMKRFIIDMQDKNGEASCQALFEVRLGSSGLCLFPLGVVDKQMCALWIKKLCDFANPPNKDPGKSAKAYTIQQQTRNSYSQLLLSMLETSKRLSHPFNEKPPTGPLKYLVRGASLWSC